MNLTNKKLEKIVNHAIYSCIDCNRFLTDLVRHYEQDICKHKYEKIASGYSCPKCRKIKVKR